MSQIYDGDSDIHIEQEIHLDLLALAQLLAASPAAMQILANALRDQLIKDSRLYGDLYGKWAQRSVPIAALPQIPGTLRIS